MPTFKPDECTISYYSENEEIPPGTFTIKYNHNTLVSDAIFKCEQINMLGLGCYRLYAEYPVGFLGIDPVAQKELLKYTPMRFETSAELVGTVIQKACKVAANDPDNATISDFLLSEEGEKLIKLKIVRFPSSFTNNSRFNI